MLFPHCRNEGNSDVDTVAWLFFVSLARKGVLVIPVAHFKSSIIGAITCVSKWIRFHRPEKFTFQKQLKEFRLQEDIGRDSLEMQSPTIYKIKG